MEQPLLLLLPCVMMGKDIISQTVVQASVNNCIRIDGKGAINPHTISGCSSISIYSINNLKLALRLMEGIL